MMRSRVDYPLSMIVTHVSLQTTVALRRRLRRRSHTSTLRRSTRVAAPSPSADPDDPTGPENRQLPNPERGVREFPTSRDITRTLTASQYGKVPVARDSRCRFHGHAGQ